VTSPTKSRQRSHFTCRLHSRHDHLGRRLYGHGCHGCNRSHGRPDHEAPAAHQNCTEGQQRAGNPHVESPLRCIAAATPPPPGANWPPNATRHRLKSAQQLAVLDHRQMPAALSVKMSMTFLYRLPRVRWSYICRHDLGEDVVLGSRSAPTTRRITSRSVKMPASRRRPSRAPRDLVGVHFLHGLRTVTVGEWCKWRAFLFQQCGNRGIHG